MKKSLLILLFFSIIPYVTFSQSRIQLQQNWSFDSFGDDLGHAGIVVKDIDKNGRPEIFASATIEGSNFQVWGYFSVVEFDPKVNTYHAKWTSRVFFSEITEIQLFDQNGDGIDELVVGFSNGEIKIFETSTFRLIKSFFISKTTSNIFNRDMMTVAFGDIDNDGTNNLVASFRDTTYVYDVNYVLKRKLAVKGGVTLANVDKDNAIEAVFSGGQIIEYGAGVNRNEYKFSVNQYSTTIVRIADMNNDGINDVLYSSSDTVHVVNVSAKNRMRSFAKKKSYGNVSDFQLFDYTNDGIPDVFMGNEQFEVLDVHDGASTSWDFSLNDPERNGLESLAIADLDSAPGMELIWTSGTNCSCPDHFFVFDLGTHTMKWMSKSATIGSKAFDVGTMSTSSITPELILGGNVNSYYGGGFLVALNAENKNQITNFAQMQGVDNVTAITTGDIDSDGKSEILIGQESMYSWMTSVLVVDSSYNRLRSFDIYGMSFATDIKIADLDGDNAKEVIITAGTNVGGSTDPEDYENYIYVFDGKSGKLEWRSAKIGGIGSYAGNLIIENIDDDPALEIVALRYKNLYGWGAAPATIYVLDGWTHEMNKHEGDDFTALTTTDFDQDGVKDIIAATLDGKIRVLDGQSFAVKKDLATNKGNITSLHAIDLNGDQTAEYVYTDQYKLNILDVVHGVTLTESDTLSASVGSYGGVLVRKNTNEMYEVLVNAGHTLFSFIIDSALNVKPSEFTLLSPGNNTLQQPREWVEFSWSVSNDIDPITYSLHLTGPHLDTLISNIRQTHVAFKASKLQLDVDYFWTVEATDGELKTSATGFTFKMGETVVMGIEHGTDHGVYPNPFTTALTVQGQSSFEIEKIKITDMRGAEWIIQEVPAQSQQTILIEDASALPTGMYMCSLISRHGEVRTVKVIKQ